MTRSLNKKCLMINSPTHDIYWDKFFLGSQRVSTTAPVPGGVSWELIDVVLDISQLPAHMILDGNIPYY